MQLLVTELAVTVAVIYINIRVFMYNVHDLYVFFFVSCIIHAHAYVVKQSSMRLILAITGLTILLAGAIYLDIRFERSSFTSNLSLEHKAEEHQRLSKLEAEEKLTSMSAVLSDQIRRVKLEVSDFKIMASHISYVQAEARKAITKAIDDEKNHGHDDIEKDVDKEFDKMAIEVKKILQDHLLTEEQLLDNSVQDAHRMQEEVLSEFKQQEDEDEKSEQDRIASTDEDIEKRLDAVFNHVYQLAEKMGETDVDHLLKKETIVEWETLLMHTESGQLPYPEAVKKMEEIIEKSPAALKLAEVTDAIELVEEDGGKQGVNEITNFRNLLREVQLLPQYSMVYEEFQSWKDGNKTVQQVLLWMQQKIAAGELDPAWMQKANAPYVEKDPNGPNA
jgi:hypothetical protein